MSGYNHKLLVLLEEVLRRIAGFQVKEDRLELIRERALKAFRNQKFQQPYQVTICLSLALRYVRLILTDPEGSNVADIKLVVNIPEE